MEFHVWLTFFAASWAISLSPGAGAIAAMSSGLNHGFRRGYFTTFGLILGIMTQIIVVGAGLGALIAASSLGFTFVKWSGVAYLVFLGIQQWRAPAVPMVAADPNAETAVTTRRQLVMRGWLINAVNPKGTVFLLAVVPQFLDLEDRDERQHPHEQKIQREEHADRAKQQAEIDPGWGHIAPVGRHEVARQGAFRGHGLRDTQRRRQARRGIRAEGAAAAHHA